MNYCCSSSSSFLLSLLLCLYSLVEPLRKRSHNINNPEMCNITTCEHKQNDNVERKKDEYKVSYCNIHFSQDENKDLLKEIS